MLLGVSPLLKSLILVGSVVEDLPQETHVLYIGKNLLDYRSKSLQRK
jgi:hypothetical protein